MVANCFWYSYEADLPAGGSPPLRPAMYPVYASPVLFTVDDSATGATLGTGCRLGLARQGLPVINRAPCTKHLAQPCSIHIMVSSLACAHALPHRTKVTRIVISS